MGGFSFSPESVSGNSLDKVMRQGTNAAGAKASSLGNLSSGLLNPASQYWMNLLSGNSAQTSGALAPDINRIRGSEASVLNSASTLAPRGGGRGTTLFGTPMTAEAQTQGLFNAMRPQAAQAAGNLGVQTEGLSQQALGQMLQSLLTRRGQNVEMDINGPMGTFMRSLAKTAGEGITGAVFG